MSYVQLVLFFACALLAISPWGSPPLSLLTGLLLALTIGNPYPKESKKWSKYLLQAAVVGLGFGLDFNTVIKAGSTGLLFTAVTILGTLLIGAAIGRALTVQRKTSLLIGVGTAICGGSAIAAVGPVLHASDEEMSVSLGTIFILNSIALFLFPVIGHMLHMTEQAFGLWSALAIHDTSSVVGAAATFGKQALDIATTVKLSRALWIIPISFGMAWLEQRRRNADGTKSEKAKITIPWFIGLFVLASIVRSLLPDLKVELGYLTTIARAMLSLTLFLIGAGLSRKTLKAVGVRPLILAVILWILIGSTTLISVLYFT